MAGDTGAAVPAAPAVSPRPPVPAAVEAAHFVLHLACRSELLREAWQGVHQVLRASLGAPTAEVSASTAPSALAFSERGVG